MHKYLAAVLGVAAFLAVTTYWLWQIFAGRPALSLEWVALRATGAGLAGWVIGRVLGRLGVSVLSEAMQEAQARARDRKTIGTMKESKTGSAGRPEGRAEARR